MNIYIRVRDLKGDERPPEATTGEEPSDQLKAHYASRALAASPANVADLIAQAEDALLGVTPGPWYANVNDLIGGYCVGPRNGPSSERQSGDPGDVADFTTEADARFIAKARSLVPRMKAALQALSH